MSDNPNEPQEPEPETEPATEPATPATPAATDKDAELAKWREMARKHERESKGKERELERLRHESMSDTEKAVAIARKEGRNEALKEAGSRLVDAEVRAAAAGRTVDVAALLEGLDRNRFLDDEGEPDLALIRKWVDRIAPPPGDDDNDGATVPRLRMGPRGQSTSPLNGGDFERDLRRAVGLQ